MNIKYNDEYCNIVNVKHITVNIILYILPNAYIYILSLYNQ